MAAARPVEGSRDAAICGRYRAGETLSSIAHSFDLSIEGVRKITRRYGLDKTNAGLAVRKLSSVRPPRAEPAWERVYGSSFIEYRDATHEERMAFLQHRSNARRKNIAWAVSLGDWVRAWRQSGKWEKWGQGPRRYGMTRRDPARGFTADNLMVARNTVSLRRARLRPAVKPGREPGSAGSGVRHASARSGEPAKVGPGVHPGAQGAATG